jgi:hypothetical protein
MLSLCKYISFATNYFFKKTQVQQSFLHITTHHTPTFTGWSGTSWVRYGFCELTSDYFAYIYIYIYIYPCKWNHASSEKNGNCGSISPSTTDRRNQLQKWTLLTGLRDSKAPVDCFCFIGPKLHQLRCPSCTILLHSSLLSETFQWFSTCMFKVWPPMSSNFSVSTWLLYFCFLSIKSPVVLSLFTKLWIVCLLGTLSSRNFGRNLRGHFLADPYFTWVSYRNTRCSEVYRTWRTTLLTDCNWEQMANGADTCCLLLTNHKLPRINRTARRETQCRLALHKLITSIHSECYRPSGMFIHFWNSCAPSSKQRTVAVKGRAVKRSKNFKNYP